MPYTIKYDKDLDFILVAVEGLLDLSLLKSLVAPDVAKAVEKYGSRRILNDLRRARLASVTDTYYMPKVAKESRVAHRRVCCQGRVRCYRGKRLSERR